MNKILGHRGPDSDGIKRHGNVIFAHNRLSVIGLEEEFSVQPIEYCGHMLTFNGEIYNYKYISEQLEEAGILCGNKSDTEVLFRSLMHWGVKKTLKLIDGMFAFAYLDPEKGLFLVRDKMGEKPLYWSYNSNRLWFASEIKAIVSGFNSTIIPNLSMISEYFHTGMIMGTETFFKDVYELAPGTYLEISMDVSKFKSKEYWKVDEFDYNLNNKVKSSIKVEFLDRLISSIASRCISEVPMGVLLSGGIDSCTLVKLMCENYLYGSNIDLYFADNSFSYLSELKDVQIFLNHLVMKHTKINYNLNINMLSASEYMNNLYKFTWQNDEPTQFPISPQLLDLTLKSSSKGIKVLLSGEGADEILFGYDRFINTRKILMGMDDEKELVISNIYYGAGLDKKSDIEDLTLKISHKAEDMESWDWLSMNYKKWNNDTLQLIYSQKYRLMSLLQRQDRQGMAIGVEVRVPFLAPELVKWVNELPFEFKYSINQTKKILRDTMRNKLPNRIIAKNKQGSPSIISHLLNSAEGYSNIKKMISRKDGFCQSFLNGDKANTIVNNHFNTINKNSTILWRFMALEIWHDIFIKQENNY